MKNYITSDLHCLHSNICKYAERKEYLPFDDEKSRRMSWDIVNSINKQVPDEPGVVLWNLGDLFYGKLFGDMHINQLKKFIDVMKGKHRQLNIVLGNHDRQFNHFRKSVEDWKKIKPFDKDSSLEDIFRYLGFDKVYDSPIIYKDKFILSHEPVFIKPNSNFTNIHGHTHQIKVDREYFAIDLENSKMVMKAYKDSGREPPTPVKKKDWSNWVVDPKDYINICWDCTDGPYKVFNLDELTK